MNKKLKYILLFILIVAFLIASYFSIAVISNKHFNDEMSKIVINIDIDIDKITDNKIEVNFMIDNKSKYDILVYCNDGESKEYFPLSIDALEIGEEIASTVQSKSENIFGYTIDCNTVAEAEELYDKLLSEFFTFKIKCDNDNGNSDRSYIIQKKIKV
ncbi:MAG: hypothetical protein NC213_06605 [Acetobacter sp.]|nr:hypothetical protein [Bacteroides sp.]MCM1341396.1 hypothetical protein [Acetobacter sp.]MCM1434134.1 hypothetical protein [Clostridiales bacterium]